MLRSPAAQGIALLLTVSAAPAAAQGAAPDAPGTGRPRAAPAAVRRARTLYTATPPGAVLACTPAPSPADDDLVPLGDEFSGDAPDGRWRWFHEANGWPSMLRAADVGRTRAGHLTLEPALSGWFADYHGPFLYQTVAGDFDVTARVRAGSAAAPGDSLPRSLWSLVGLMARAPRPVSPATWAPRAENWLFLTTGTAEAPGVPVFETKSTVNSGSNLKLRPGRSGWVELRLVRLRETFLLLSRLPGERWRVRERVLRRDLPGAVQVGVTAYSDGTSAPPAMADPAAYNTAAPAERARYGRPDLRAAVDYVRVRRPPRLSDVAPDWLVDHDVSEATLLRFLACGGSDA
jgi:hypothetical protein